VKTRKNNRRREQKWHVQAASMEWCCLYRAQRDYLQCLMAQRTTFLSLPSLFSPALRTLNSGRCVSIALCAAQECS
jgi:hypothetical protein